MTHSPVLTFCLVVTIHEFSELSGANSSALRYWDEMGVISPACRNIENGYRYYSPDQIMMVRLLKLLGNLNFPLKDLAGVANNRERMLALCRDIDDQLVTKIAELQAGRDMLQGYASQVEQGQDIQPDRIEVRELPAQPIRCIPLEGKRLHRSITQAGPSGSPLGYYYDDLYDLLEQPGKPARLVSFDRRGTETRPAGKHLIGTARCTYGETGGLPRRMLEYALQYSLGLHGPAFVAYLPDASSAMRAENYLLQITVTVASDTAGL